MLSGIVRVAFFVALISLRKHVLCNRVLELSDKFLEVYNNGQSQWLVKFYAPWCHHCKELEPTFSQVAQMVHNEDIGVYVARLDCTRFTGVATHFNIKGFPTILFISADSVVEYNGDRNKDEITDFARRLSGPIIRTLSDCKDLDDYRNRHAIYFVSVGEEMWSNYSEAAKSFRMTNWFYHISIDCPNFGPGIYAIKSSIVNNNKAIKYNNGSSVPLREWIKYQRFPQFVKLTPGNFNVLLNSGKLLAVALVEEYRIVGKLVSMKHEEFRDMVEAIAHTYDSEEKIIFAWTSHMDIINSIAIQTINPLPNFIAINTTTLQYYLMEGEILPQNIISLLNDLKNDSSSILIFGGNTYWHRFVRVVYEASTTLSMMYKGNPILTLVIFGLPLSFLSVIVYTSCCSDILDAKDDEEDEKDENDVHDKKD